jgi:NAD+ diphosphatase
MNMTTRWQPCLLDLATAGGWVLACSRQGFLADSNGVLFPREWFKRQDLPAYSEHGLGLFDGERVYLLELASAADLPGCSWQGLRQFMLMGDADQFRMLGFAAQIATWIRHHRFCGACGEHMLHDCSERTLRCPSCELRCYPQLSPSMIVLVTRGDEILLARSPNFASGFYSTLAGFVEPGESVEQCVRREVQEEVGLQVHNLRYLGSQNWPFPHSLMLGYHAEYAGGEIVPQPGEIEDARWFTLDQLPQLPPQQAISRYLIELYRAQRLGLPEPVLPG